jgi:FkbM family methyltransferase
VDAYLVGEVFGGQYDLPDVVGERLARLDRPARVVDLGGNIGLFGLHIHGKLACRVTSVEPDPRNAAILRRCVAANPHLDWEIVEAAAGTENWRKSTSRAPSGPYSPTRVSPRSARAR